MTRKPITEEDGVHDAWYVRAKAMTPAELPAFIAELTDDYAHDYGTVCHAIAAAAVATAHAVNRSEGARGGITGFQAGAIMWEFMRHWNHVEFPAWLRTGDNLLFPQYADEFRTISPEIWTWLQAQAAKRLAARGHASDGVLAHWRSIVDGVVPFGLRVAER